MNELFQFANLWWLCLLIIPIAIRLLPHAHGGARFSAYALLKTVIRTSRGPAIFKILMATGLSLLIVAAARPQYGSEIVEYTSEGRDLMLVIDLSLSMRLDDMTNDAQERITRLAAVIKAANTFIEGRPNDRMGLVFFSEQALVSCPLTYDHGTLHDILGRTQSNLESLWNRNSNLLGRGTNIGLGLGYAIKTLDKHKGDEEKLGRAIILITDGRDSEGHQEPMLAAKHAHNADIRIHSIGVGNAQGTYTSTDMIGRTRTARIGRNELPDMNLLKKIARSTSGVAMSAGNKEELKTVFEKIDELEPSPRDEQRRDNYSDHFLLPLILGLLLCFVGLICEPRLRGALA